MLGQMPATLSQHLNNMHYDYEVDATGLKCPLPILRCKKGLNEIKHDIVLDYNQRIFQTLNLSHDDIIVDKTDGGGRLYAELPADAARTLPPGAFVQIDFIGREFVDAFELPEEALVGQDKVYVVEEGRARERLITVLQRAPGRIWVSGALMTGDKVIATRLPGIGDGLKVRIADTK